MVSVYLPFDALSQHLPPYLGFSNLGRGVSLQGCSSKAQPPLLTLDEVAPPDLHSQPGALGCRPRFCAVRRSHRASGTFTCTISPPRFCLAQSSIPCFFQHCETCSFHEAFSGTSVCLPCKSLAFCLLLSHLLCYGSNKGLSSQGYGFSSGHVWM